MFKKNISVATSRPLSGKDAKKMKKDVSIHFPDVTDDDLADLFPAKVEIVLHKLSNKATMYGLQGGNPLFFDPEGRGDSLVPTVYALWKVPRLLGALHTYSEVSPKVLGGADLFLQGLIVPPQGLGDFSAGDLRVVAIPRNPFPFAVGTLEVSSADVARSGMKGKGLRLLHHYPDQLWGLGDRSVPDPSFTPTRVFPQESGASGAASDAAPADPAPGMANLTITSTAEVAPPSPMPSDGATSSAAFVSSPPADQAHRGEGEGGGESQDTMVEVCLLRGLHTLSDGELPIQTSDFYSKHMLAAKPPGTVVDIKKSSYKKLSTLLKKYEKKGLLSVKQVHKQDNISTVNRAHELYVEAGEQLACSGNEGERASGMDEAPQGAPEATPSTTSAPTNSRHISVTYCYKVPTSLRAVFEEGAGKEELHSEEQCSEALRAYALREGLLEEGATSLKLDKRLLGSLFNKKEPQGEGDLHPMEDTLRRLLSKLHLHHRISRPTDKGVVEAVKKGSVKKVVIAMEDRQGGRKHITRITHVESFAIPPDELANQLQRKFQTSSSVTKLPGKQETDKEIALQGNLLHEAARFLAEEYGLDPSHVEVKQKGKP